MKRKLICIISIFVFIMVGAIVVRSENTNAVNEVKKWCSGKDNDSAAKNYENFATNYVLEDSKLHYVNMAANYNGTITYNYTYSSNGNLRIEYTDNRGRQVRYPNGNNVIEIDIILPRGDDQISLYSYPNIKKDNPFTDASLASVCRKDAVEEASDVEDEHYIYELTYSLPIDSMGGGIDNSGFATDASVDVNGLNKGKTTDIKLYCQFDPKENTNKKYSYTVKENSTNGYFEVVCDENLNLSYDSPKETYPGGGFKYTVGLDVARTCKIIRKKAPVVKTICRPSFYFTDHNNAYGGPNDDFNNCINSCDGGLYSKECSKSCYSKVYGNSKQEPINFMDSKKGKVEKMIVTPGSDNSTNPDPWCYVESIYNPPRARSYRSGNRGWHWQVCPSASTKAGGHSSTISVYPDSSKKAIPNVNNSNSKRGTVYGCVYGYQGNSCSGSMVCNNNCSKDSVETAAQQKYYYQKELNIYYSDLAEVLKKLNINTDPKKFNSFNTPIDATSASITEEALKTAKITRKVNYNNSGKTKEFSEGQLLTEVVNNVAYVNFPKAFINLENGNIEYTTSDKKDNKYIYGGNLFYTDINATADDTNDSRYYPTTAEGIDVNKLIRKTGLSSTSTYNDGKSLNWNVSTKIKDLGTKGQWDVDISCFYGTYEGEKKELANLPYKYRTVNLDDLFPNRTPGYNWTNNVANEKASSSSYDIDPEALIQSIKSKGDSGTYSSPYMSFKIGTDGFNWSNVQSDRLYTTFDGKYEKKSDNGILFFSSDLLKGIAQSFGSNRSN